DYLLAGSAVPPEKPPGDHRMGRRHFVELGCAACHLLPDGDEPSAPGRTPLTGLNDRFPPAELAAFLANPLSRYPDHRMPRLSTTPEAARDIAAYVLLWSKPARDDAVKPPTPEEVAVVSKRLKTYGRDQLGSALVREKRCAACHAGLGQTVADVPMNDEKR